MVCLVATTVVISAVLGVTGTPTYYRSARSLNIRAVGAKNNSVPTGGMRDPGPATNTLHGPILKARAPPKPVQDPGSSSSQGVPSESMELGGHKGQGTVKAAQNVPQEGQLQYRIPLENLAERKNRVWLAEVNMKGKTFKLHVDTGTADITVYGRKVPGQQTQLFEQANPEESDEYEDLTNRVGLLASAYYKGNLYSLPERDPKTPWPTFNLGFSDESGGWGRVTSDRVSIAAAPEPLIVEDQQIGVFNGLNRWEPLGLWHGTMGLGSARYSSIFRPPSKGLQDEGPREFLPGRNFFENYELRRTAAGGQAQPTFTLDFIHSEEETQHGKTSSLTIGACLCQDGGASGEVNIEDRGAPYMLSMEDYRPGKGGKKDRHSGVSMEIPFSIVRERYLVDSGTSVMILRKKLADEYYKVVDKILKSKGDPANIKRITNNDGDKCFVPCSLAEEMPELKIPNGGYPIRIPGKLLVNIDVKAPPNMKSYISGSEYCLVSVTWVTPKSVVSGENAQQEFGVSHGEASSSVQGASRQSAHGSGSGPRQKRGNEPATQNSESPRELSNYYTRAMKLGVPTLGVPFFLRYTTCFELPLDPGIEPKDEGGQAGKIHKRVDPTGKTSSGSVDAIGRFRYCNKDLTPVRLHAPPERKGGSAQPKPQKSKGLCGGCLNLGDCKCNIA